jgi:predicted  nucleic acid-binding Zn-ribbon protein
MWGKLVDLAAAAAEQVQKEAINIANDGFDLLDKLDNTMNNTEGQEDEERMKIDASSDLVDREISKGEVGTSTLARSELLSSPLETRDEKTSPISLPIKPPAPDSPKKSPVKRGTFSPLAKISSPPKPQEVDDPASYRALADLKSVLWCSPSASMEEVLERVKEVLHENGEQAEVIRGLSESLDAKESAHRLEIAELKEHLVQSNGRLSVLEASLDEKEKRAQEQASSSLNQIASLQRELSSALDQVAALEAGVADSHSKWLREEAALLTKCETLSSEKEKMATDLRTKESELRSMLEKLEGSDLSIVSLNARVEALVLELRSLEQNRSAMEQEHARQLEASTEANSTLTQKLAEARKQLKGKVAGKNTYTDEINKLKSELAEANERVSALERLKLEESASFLAQISALVEVRDAYEQSIAELRQQVQEKSSALEDMSASRASPAAAPEVPRTPERATRHAQITGPDSPDDSSFKTPGPAPKSSLGKGKQRPNGKSKAEVTDEIKTLSSQLHSLKAMQVLRHMNHYFPTNIYVSVYMCV